MSAPESARSYLFVPGNRPERFDKACNSGADAVILDLEDAVAPDEKVQARAHIRQWLTDGGKAYVRLNAAHTSYFADDCRLLSVQGLQGIMLPEAQSVVAVRSLAAKMPAGLALILLIENAQGMYRAAELAQIEGVSRLAFGSVDYKLDCQIPDESGLIMARQTLVLASAVGRLSPPIESVTINLDDTAVLEQEAEQARQFGFGAKLCIHPRQVETVNRVFSPSEADIERAQRILAAVEQSENLNAARLDGHLLEKPIIEWARRILG
ncbi:MAG TPA: CoA ester lyase [Burkholderiaceae bacterium]|nr:CoA ester lyase [Burkholderiaceae bacterium]